MAREDSILLIVWNELKKWVKTRKAWAGIAGTAMLIIGLGIIFSYQVQAFPAKNPFNYQKPSGDLNGPANAKLDSIPLTGNAPVGTPMSDKAELKGNRIYSMRVTLAWTDEANAGRRWTNQPDTFDLEVALPDGTTKKDSGSGSNSVPGQIVLEWNWTKQGGVNWADAKKGTVNEITVTVTCTKAGPQVPRLDILKMREKVDPGNDYTATVEYRYTD